MIRATWLLVLGFVALGPVLAKADDTYTIKLKQSAKGDVGQLTKDETEDNNVTVSKGGQVLQQMKNARKETVKYKEEIIEKEQGKPATKLRRTYDKAVATVDGKDMDLPYNGKVLLIEKKDGKYSFQIEKGDVLKEKDVPGLVKEFSKDDDEEKIQELFVPKKAVAAGDTWKIDKDALKALLGKDTGGIKFDADKATATGKLLKAYKKDDKQFGVMQYDIDLPLDSLQGMAFEKGAKMTVSLTVDVCIDGSSDAGTVKSKFSMKGEINNQGTGIVIDVAGTSTQTREEGKK